MKTIPLLILALLVGIDSRADVVLEPPGATVAGKTIGEWSTNWWQWAAPLAPPGDPFTDRTGEFADVHQSGPVFLLAGSPGDTRARRFEVPPDTYVLLPLLVGEVSQLEAGFDKTEDQLRQAAQQQATTYIDSLHATLDGVSIPSATLFTHLETSPAFSFVGVSGNLVNVPAGYSGMAVASGYFLMLSPLTPGTHVLNYGGGISLYGVYIDETDTIAVGPHYVDGNCTNPIPPYTNWATAATTIQDAVGAAGFGGQILVTNGTYASGGQNGDRVWLDKRLTLLSVNGPAVTVIDGSKSLRCVELADRASLAGFTLTNGFIPWIPFTNTPFSSGGGVAFDGYPSSAVVSNCVIVGNSAPTGGGAGSAVVTGGLTPMAGALINCVLSNNSATAFQPGNGTLGIGGAADNCKLIDCVLAGNFAALGGGGASVCRLQNCTLTGNSGNAEGGATRWSTLFNCLVTSNSSGSGATFSSTLINCTVAGNPAGGAYSGFLTNCIVYDNGGAGNQVGATLNYCCTTPLPPSGIGNITNAPLFVDEPNGNLRLKANSLCINAGDNSATSGLTDLDGRTRLQGGAIDLGAYEFQPGVSGDFIGWLSGFGLPTDGSADYADTDADGINNWQEWVAGTVPTDASSALRLLSPTKSPPGVVLTWQSVNNRTYFLERATGLAAGPIFSVLTSNIVGQAGTTSFTDTNVVGSGPFFYRVGVQP